tara:strand:+ start:23 stop:838 length:816 start_codon:yes stop_codon:yes gene_type:complete
MGIGKVSSLAVASLAKVSSLAKASINKINSVTASFAAAFTDSISFDFDGTNDYLHFAQGNVGGDLQTSGSVSIWAKLDPMSANGVMWQITAEEGTDDQLFILWHNASAVVRGNVKLGGTANIVDSGAGLENDGNWHHFVMTWMSGSKTSSDNIVRLYVDGSQTDTDAIGNTWGNEAAPAAFVIGRNNIQSNAYFRGHLNDIAIFDDVLTSSEVTAIYNSGEPQDESDHSGLIAYYTMEAYSDNDTTVADDSGNSKTLNINNSTNIDSSDTP